MQLPLIAAKINWIQSLLMIKWFLNLKWMHHKHNMYLVERLLKLLCSVLVDENPTLKPFLASSLPMQEMEASTRLMNYKSKDIGTPISIQNPN